MAQLTSQSEVFTRSVEDVITKEELDTLLKSGKKLRVKLGIDATSADLHIGHGAALWKLRALQEAGHKAVIIMGDATTRIGDPTGKTASRPVLEPDVIKKNIASIRKQAEHILLTKPTVYEVHSNSEWFGAMKTMQFLDIVSHVTHARLIERDMFQERIRQGKEITALEMLYPVMQGYDSVAIKSDMTVIGSDQLFNEHMGRFFQERFGQKPQVIVTLKLLPGIGGGEKMSKSLGNYIGLADTPQDKFGKAMRITDDQIVSYLEAYTAVSMSEIERVKRDLEGGKNPMESKLFFANELVARYHGPEAAKKERERFVTIFSRRELPEEIPSFTVRSANIIDIMVAIGFAPTRSEARRLIKQRAVEVDGKRIDENTGEIEKKDGVVIKAGKRRIAKLTFKG